MNNAQRRRWTRFGGSNIYTGVFLTEHLILVSDLSNGIRTLDGSGPSKFVFDDSYTKDIKVSDAYIQKALAARVTDLDLQKIRSEHEMVIAD